MNNPGYSGGQQRRVAGGGRRDIFRRRPGHRAEACAAPGCSRRSAGAPPILPARSLSAGSGSWAAWGRFPYPTQRRTARAHRLDPLSAEEADAPTGTLPWHPHSARDRRGRPRATPIPVLAARPSASPDRSATRRSSQSLGARPVAARLGQRVAALAKQARANRAEDRRARARSRGGPRPATAVGPRRAARGSRRLRAGERRRRFGPGRCGWRRRVPAESHVAPRPPADSAWPARRPPRSRPVSSGRISRNLWTVAASVDWTLWTGNRALSERSKGAPHG